MDVDKENEIFVLLPKRHEEHVVCTCLLEEGKLDKIACWRLDDGCPGRQCQMSLETQ